MAAGGIIGGVLGGIAGGASLALLYLSGTSMEDIRYWQYKWRLDRDQQISEAIKSQVEEEKKSFELIKEHDMKVGEEISLENVK